MHVERTNAFVGRRWIAHGLRKPRQITAWFCLALMLITSAMALLSEERLRYLDEEHYHQLALRIVEGRGYTLPDATPTAFRPPGYPAFLASLYCVWKNPLAGKLANAILLGLLAWILGAMVARTEPCGRMLPPLLILLYPVLPYTATTLYPQTLGAVLLSATVFLLTTPRPNRTTVSLAGILLGLLCLAIPFFLMMLPLLALLFAHQHRRMRAQAAFSCLLLLGVTFATLLPWTARNAFRFGEFVLISTNSGRNLFLGNNAQTTPTLGVNLEIPEEARPDPSWDEPRVDRHFRSLALQWVLDDPGQASLLYLRKGLAYFHFRNRLFTVEESSRKREILLMITYYPLLFLGIVRLRFWRHLPLSPEERSYYLLYVGSALLSAVFFPRIRFRLPFDALLIAGVATLLGRRMRSLLNAASPDRP